MLIRWISEYDSRADALSLAAHRSLYDGVQRDKMGSPRRKWQHHGRLNRHDGRADGRDEPEHVRRVADRVSPERLAQAGAPSHVAEISARAIRALEAVRKELTCAP